MRKTIKENLAHGFLWVSAFLTLGILFTIIFNIVGHGISNISWSDIMPAIVGTVYLVIIALVVAAPLGVMVAIYLNEYTKKEIFSSILRFFIEILASIPSIVIGLFGFLFFIVFLGWDLSIMSGGLTVALMILPTIVRTTEEAIKSVPLSYREGSLALGATRWQTIYNIILPSALPSIVTGIILGIGRVVGETAALYITIGISGFQMPTSVWDPARTLSVHLFVLASEGISLEQAYATATVLIITVFFINFVAKKIMYAMVKN
jgi:phosphate transport system permease protein